MEYHIKSRSDIQTMMYDHYRIFNGRDVVKELGEPLFIDFGDTWIFDDKERGFITYNAAQKKVKYLYVFFPFRRFGVGSMFLSMLPKQEFNTVATKKSKSIFEKVGFETTREFTNYFKMQRNG